MTEAVRSAAAVRPRSRRERSALWQLTRLRMLTFLREPEAVFWVFAFPVLMALVLGIAFRNQGPRTSRIGVEDGPHGAAIAAGRQASPALEVLMRLRGEVVMSRRRWTVVVVR